jgi:hypothetical protein
MQIIIVLIIDGTLTTLKKILKFKEKLSLNVLFVINYKK